MNDPDASPGSDESDPVVIPVAVIVPSYKRKEYLPRALSSVAAQKGVRPMEVIVIDDGSNDGTAELARSLGARVIQKERNEGLSAARDDGMIAAEGAEWLALLDDDDLWLPHHLQTVWSQRGNHVMVAGTSISFGDEMPRAHGTPFERAEVVRSPARLVFPENSFTTSAVLVRRDVLLAAGGFDRSLRYLEDLDAWLRVLEHGTGLLLPQMTCLYRHHRGQLSRHRTAMVAASAQVIGKYGDRPWLGPQARQGVLVVEHWDDLQSARRERDWAGAGRKTLWILARPSRWRALVQLWVFRRRARQRKIGHELMAARAAAERRPEAPAGSS